jgi:Polysaccharide biosynthesis C-terminal domain
MAAHSRDVRFGASNRPTVSSISAIGARTQDSRDRDCVSVRQLSLVRDAQCHRSQGLNAWATGLAAALNIGLNLLLIPYYGYLAASANTVVTELALCVFGWWFVQYRRSHLRLPWVRLSWRILVAGVAMGVLLYALADLPIYVSAPVGGIAYLLAVYALRVIEPAEWELVRTGLLNRYRLVT